MAAAEPDYFASIDRAVVERAPFPHAVIDQALPPGVADQLARDAPDVPTQDDDRGNRRFDLGYYAAMHDPRVTPLWRAVLTQAMSQRTMQRILRLFADDIRREHPDFERRHGALERLVAHPRYDRRWPRRALGLESRVAINSPAREPTPTVKGPHIDMPNKLFFGLLYLRLDGDEAEGGDLVVVEPTREALYSRGREYPQDATRVVRTVPYRRDRMVLILNTPRSLHAVSPRAPTPVPRMFMNVIAETRRPLFHVPIEGEPPPPPPPWWSRLIGAS